ncbi:MAG TPA: acyl-CoA dehydrogenase family protein [Candidatus Limnocylindrales bacterium]|nr:acyl-CoA dehydrogenase family protein [Candidatus Limnocylindrales bacterium]
MLPYFDQDHVALQGRVRAWVVSNLLAGHDGEVNIERRARSLVQQLGAVEFFKYTVPLKFGGMREKVGALDLCIFREELARGDALADTMFALQALGSFPITLAGAVAQKQNYLPRVACGAAIAAFAITEPEAGSDVASLQTTAVRQGEQFVLNGTKRFISNAGIADYYVVFASTEPAKKAKGVSAFVVDANTPGVALKEKTQLLSPHPIGVLEFTDCIVPQSALLGAEGDGLKIALETLDLLRCSVGAAAVGFAQRALEEAIQYSKTRRQFGRAIGEFQGIQFKLAEMATELEAARLLVYQAAWVHDCGNADSKQKSSMAKFYATEAAQRIVDQALQLHGGNGLVAGTIMERLYRDVRALRIYEGTSEIQKLVIARGLLK